MISRFSIIFIPIIIAAAGQIILKIGMNHIGTIDLQKTGIINYLIKIASSPTVVIGLIFYGLSALLWLIVLSKEELSFVYPMVAFSYVITVILSMLFLKEIVPPLRWLGLIVICFGIFLIAKSAK
jgi:drug/metabolite transporter (DMT)-like permease